MKIAIIGAGNIGGNLGKRWSEKGHHIYFGVRNPDKAKDLVAACGAHASATDVQAACKLGEVIILSVPWSAAEETLKSAGDLSGKILIDATNALKWSDGPVPIVETSAGQVIAGLVPGAKVVKAFNTLGAEHILNPVVGGLQADVFLCGDDPEAKEVVKKLSEEIGFRAVDVGPLRNAKLTEHLAIAWIHLAMKGGLGRNIAFKVLS